MPGRYKTRNIDKESTKSETSREDIVGGIQRETRERHYKRKRTSRKIPTLQYMGSQNANNTQNQTEIGNNTNITQCWIKLKYAPLEADNVWICDICD